MINTEEFSKRLEKIIDFYGLSASAFAENIGVQRSSISHILSGRNKPSLDFVMKILDTYPEVELYWLLNGRGNFPYINNNAEKTEIIKDANSEVNLFSKTPNDVTVEKENSSNETFLNKTITSSKGKSIERIVIFYNDGSFSNFENSQ